MGASAEVVWSGNRCSGGSSVTDFGLITQSAIGIVFLISVVGKLKDPRMFAPAIEDYEIIPEQASLIASVLIMAAEVGLSIAHLAGFFVKSAALLGCGLFISFAVSVTINLRRRRTLPCYCFDTRGGSPISGRTLLRLCVLICAELFLVLQPTSTWVYWNVSGTNLYLADIGWHLFWAVLLLATCSWIVSLPEVLELLSKRSQATAPKSVHVS